MKEEPRLVEQGFIIYKDRRKLCGSYNGANKAIRYDLVFRVILDPFEGDIFENDVKEYRELGVYRTEAEIKADDKESMDAIFNGASIQDLLNMPDRKIRALVSNEWLSPLHGFLTQSKKDPHLYIFREYFHNDPIVNATMDAIPNAWCSSELHRLLTILCYCWD